VVDLEPRGDLIRVITDFAFADITPATAAALDLVPGSAVWAGFSIADLTVYPLHLSGTPR
jgi:molybdate transport system ATP-binding protein